MTIYIFTFAIVILLSTIAERSKTKKKTYWTSIGIIVLLLSLVAGLRDIGIGTDTTTYTEAYFFKAIGCKKTQDVILCDDPSIDKAYLLLNYIGSLFTHTTWIALFFTEIVISLGVYIGASLFFKDKKGLTLFTFLYLLIFYNQSLNYMRQMCAVSFVYIAAYCFFHRKWLIAALLMVIAYHFHSSAILGLLIPILYYICQIENNKKRNIFLAVALVGALFLYGNFYYYLGLFGNSGLINEAYADRYGTMSSYKGMVKFPKTDLLIMSFIYVFYYLAFRKKIVKNNFCTFAISVHSLYIIIYILANYIVFLYRMSFYFYIVDITCLVVVLTQLKNIRIFRYMFYALVIFSWYYSYVIKESCETYPYTSKILGI